MTPEQAQALREPFKPEQIGKLPKPTNRDNKKGKCSECGGYHGLPAVHLDYVGHAAITDRLLQVDPEWSWEPMATDPHGFPLLDPSGGLWIKLTVCGVTRPGYGDETNGKGMKEVIGDALRNAAMRFGVGLDLRSKEKLTADDDAPPANQATGPAAQPPAAQQPRPADTGSQFQAPVVNEQQVKDLWSLVRDMGVPDAAFADIVTDVTGKASTKTIPVGKLDEIIARIEQWAEAA